jgi:hypothetical protein
MRILASALKCPGVVISARGAEGDAPQLYGVGCFTLRRTEHQLGNLELTPSSFGNSRQCSDMWNPLSVLGH